MEFTRLVETVLHKTVQPQGQPDTQLVEQLATAMGHVTVVHKGTQQLATAMGHVTIVHKGR